GDSYRERNDPMRTASPNSTLKRDQLTKAENFKHTVQMKEAQKIGEFPFQVTQVKYLQNCSVVFCFSQAAGLF
ncbi:hypothetical protein ACQP3J_33900, partial [Escherichia coli]